MNSTEIRIMSESRVPEKRFRIEKHPPEGGWGYLIGVGMALPFVSIKEEENQVNINQLSINNMFFNYDLLRWIDLCIEQHAFFWVDVQ